MAKNLNQILDICLKHLQIFYLKIIILFLQGY